MKFSVKLTVAGDPGKPATSYRRDCEADSPEDAARLAGDLWVIKNQAAPYGPRGWREEVEVWFSLRPRCDVAGPASGAKFVPRL